MRKQKIECAVRFNLWNVHGSWFWCLVYPRQEGGAIGVAPSEPQAVEEARAAIRQVAQLDSEHGMPLRLSAKTGLTEQIQYSKDSQSRIRSKLDQRARHSECFRPRARRLTRPGIADVYKNLWEVALRQYVTQVAHS
jgi:hypothetical protein